MASKSVALKHWSRIISRWPVDKVRPEAVSFQTLMKKRLEAFENPAKAAESAKIKGNEAQVQPVDFSWNENKEMKNVNALYALLEDRFAKNDPLPERLRYPASSSDHYETIMAESERAPNRGIFQNIKNKLSGMIRLR